MKTIYLAKQGTISGPFTTEEWAKIQASGGSHNYTWIWQDRWMPTDPAPLEDPTQRVSKLVELDSPISVVCHDFKRAISGVLCEVTDRGCVLLATAESQSVRFQENSQLQMNLLVEKTGQSMNLPVRFLRQSYGENGWNYLLQWSRVPSLLSEE